MTSTTRKSAASRDAERAAWDRIATGYDEFVTPSHVELAGQALERAGVGSGMRFLDVAAGSGALSLPAARLGARVLATDLSPRMLHRLEARARAEGLELETRAMDGHALDLEDATFDVAGSQFGVMLFPDMPRGIREMARVVRPGGRVVMVAFGDPKEIGFLQCFVEALRSVAPAFPGLPTDPPPLPLQLRDPKRLHRELEAAGLKSVGVQTTTETLVFPVGEALWNWLVHSNPIVEAIQSDLALSEDQREGLRQALVRIARTRADADGRVRLTSPVHIGVGTK